METKMFELRDEGTLIPVLAIKLGFEVEEEAWLLTRAGYNTTPYVLLCQIHSNTGKRCTTDINAWDSRTYTVAHNYIREHFDYLPTGEVIDVEFILGETKEKKISERYSDALLKRLNGVNE